MNILFTIYRALGYGGAEVSTKNLAHGMEKLGHKVVIASTQNYEGIDTAVFPEFHTKMFHVQKKVLVDFLVGIIKENNIGIVHCQDRLTSIAGVIAAKKCGVPVLVHFRDFWYACPRSSCTAPDGHIYKVCSYSEIFRHYPYFRWLIDCYKWHTLKKWRKILNMADAKIVSSKMEFERLSMIGIDKNAVVIPISRDMNLFRNVGGVPGFRRKYRIGRGDIVVSLIGSLFYTKGVGFALKFMDRVLNENRNVKFFIAGDGDMESDVLRFREKYLSNVIYSGRLAFGEILKLYNCSDIVLLPSVWEEPFSGIPLEAGAVGKVVVASSRGAAKEIKSEHMIIVEKLDANAWAEVLGGLIKDNRGRKKMGRAGMKFIADNYDNELIVSRISELYQRLI